MESMAWSEMSPCHLVLQVHLHMELAGTATPSRVAQVPLARRVGSDKGTRAEPMALIHSLSWLLSMRSSSSRGAKRSKWKSPVTKTGEEKEVKARREERTSGRESGGR